MPQNNEKYDEHIDNRPLSVLELRSLHSEILWWDQLVQIKNYLNSVYNKLSSMKVQSFTEMSKEKDFKTTIIAIQTALKAMGSDPKHPQDYNIWKIDWEYNDTTKESIKQFQTNQKMNQIDGIPWKNTIWQIIKSLEKLINNKKEYTHIRNIIDDSIRKDNVRYRWSTTLYTKALTTKFTDYIIKWLLWTNNDTEIENQIKKLADNPLNFELQKMIQESKKSWKMNLLNKLDFYDENTQYDKLIIEYSKQYSGDYEIDPALIKIMMYTESRFNPNAHSWAWAKWLMQLTPIAVKEVNKWDTIVTDVYDPKQNIHGWIKLFSQLLNKYNWDISLALAAYNAGSGSVKKAGNKIPNKAETKKYVKIITSIYEKLT